MVLDLPSSQFPWVFPTKISNTSLMHFKSRICLAHVMSFWPDSMMWKVKTVKLHIMQFLTCFFILSSSHSKICCSLRNTIHCLFFVESLRMVSKSIQNNVTTKCNKSQNVHSLTIQVFTILRSVITFVLGQYKVYIVYIFTYTYSQNTTIYQIVAICNIQLHVSAL